MLTSTPKPIQCLVLDAGPIIKNEPPLSTLLRQAETLFTTPAVIEEIRDAVTRARIESTLLPFLTLRSPRLSSIKFVSDFARRTGDLEVLSRPDIQLMALAYELECEKNHGDWRLRSVPGQKRLNGAPPESLKGNTPQGIPGPTTAEGSNEVEAEQASAPETRDAWGAPISTEADPKPTTEPKGNSLKENLEKTNIYSWERQETQLPGPDILAITSEAEIEHFMPSNGPVEEVQGSDPEDFGNEGWITPSNLKNHQEKDANGSTKPQEESKLQVALITSDFAMQNVLLRMNLNLMSPSLQRIRQLKTWVLRCHACFHITKDMSKQFCSRCGKPTLLRTSCSTDKDGSVKVHLKKNMQWSTRGNVYSIPKPVAGTSNGKLVAGGGKGGWGQSLILAEDQKEYAQAITGARRKKEKDLMDEDYLPSILSGDRGRAGERPKVGAGKNVNAKKRR
jgi:RNA-binding protein NOB1